MRELQKEVDDMRAGEETLEALRQGLFHYDEDGVNRPEMPIGAGAGVAKVATLEAQITGLSHLEMCADISVCMD